MKKFSALSLAILLSVGLHAAQAQTPAGEVKGTATAHTEASAKGVMAGAQLVLPTQATGGAAYVGRSRMRPPRRATRCLWWCSCMARRAWGSRPLVNGSNGWAAWALPAWRPTRLRCLTA